MKKKINLNDKIVYSPCMDCNFYINCSAHEVIVNNNKRIKVPIINCNCYNEIVTEKKIENNA